MRTIGEELELEIGIFRDRLRQLKQRAIKEKEILDIAINNAEFKLKQAEAFLVSEGKDIEGATVDINIGEQK